MCFWCFEKVPDFQQQKAGQKQPLVVKFTENVASMIRNKKIMLKFENDYDYKQNKQ